VPFEYVHKNNPLKRIIEDQLRARCGLSPGQGRVISVQYNPDTGIAQGRIDVVFRGHPDQLQPLVLETLGTSRVGAGWTAVSAKIEWPTQLALDVAKARSDAIEVAEDRYVRCVYLRSWKRS